MLSALLLYGVRTFLPPAKTGNQQADLLVEAKVRKFCGKKGKGGGERAKLWNGEKAKEAEKADWVNIICMELFLQYFDRFYTETEINSPY